MFLHLWYLNFKKALKHLDFWKEIQNWVYCAIWKTKYIHFCFKELRWRKESRCNEELRAQSWGRKNSELGRRDVCWDSRGSSEETSQAGSRPSNYRVWHPSCWANFRWRKVFGWLHRQVSSAIPEFFFETLGWARAGKYLIFRMCYPSWCLFQAWFFWVWQQAQPWVHAPCQFFNGRCCSCSFFGTSPFFLSQSRYVVGVSVHEVAMIFVSCDRIWQRNCSGF